MSCAPNTTANSATARPRYVASFSGPTLNPVMPSIAKFQSCQNDHLVWPAPRGSRSYATAMLGKPTQANSPFMNRWCSRNCCTASTTRRLISRK